ncbi:MAG: CoA-transferase, partial [Betaproteobacteria bacterium]
VGGAMDLAIGAKRTFVMMEHTTKTGQSKLVPSCTYPLTGRSCVSRIYTDLAVIELRQGRGHVIDHVPGITLAQLQAVTGIELLPG